MKKLLWNNTQFITSAVTTKQYPKALYPHIALVGRSNVGKSSLLNTLCNNKKLVKVSSTPGKTQLINFFCIDDALFFVDLPGYGFAKCPPSVKKEWGEMIESYFKHADRLSLLLVLLDIRRKPNEEDMQLLEWAEWHQKPVLLVFTKTDKCNQKEKNIQTKLILDSLPRSDYTYVLHSSLTGDGTKDVQKRIETTIFGDTICPY